MAQIKVIAQAKNWITNNKQEALLLFGILLLAAFLRLFRISEYLTFLGDEGRDVIIVRRLLLYADPILVGPGTSIGNMYLGPLYYYFMAPWLWLFNYSPVGPAVGVALLGIATVWLVWWVAREWFPAKGGQGKIAGLVAALLYAVAPTVIIYSRASWNPNIMPFFALLSIYSIWKIWSHYVPNGTSKGQATNPLRWFIILGISFAFAMQSHYLGLLLAPVFAIFWLITFLSVRKTKSTKKLFIHSLFGAAVFLFLMSPLVLFDARHGWRNADAIKKFFFERQATVSARPWNAIPKMIPTLQKITSRLVTAHIDVLGQITALVFFVPLFWLRGKSQYKNAFFVLFAWLGISLLGLGLYKQEIYDHYYGFFFPAPFLLIGGISQVIISKSKIRGASLVIVGIIILVVANLLENPLKYSPNRQLQRTEEVALEIIKLSDGEKFNLAVIAERNYDDAYEYFLRVHNSKMIDIDPQNTKETIADQLFVVCEMPEKKCDPTHNPKAEVANFGWSKIAEKWEVAGTIIFKLEHSQ